MNSPNPNKIARAVVAYKDAVKAWTVLLTALHFSEEAEDLILRLSLERFMLQTWGSNAGLENDTTLHPSLFPVFSLIEQVLQRIADICTRSDALQERYGLSDNADDGSKSERTKNLVRNMQIALRRSGANFKTSDAIEGDVDTAELQVPVWKRFRWGLRDKTRFESLIDVLGSCIYKLNGLLTESQRRGVVSDRTRINIVVIGRADDQESAELLRRAVQGGSADLKIRDWVERKAIADDKTGRLEADVLQPLEAEDFDLPAERKKLRRMFVQENGGAKDYVVLERKAYAKGLEASDRDLLERRMQNLVLLLSSSSTSQLRTLKSIGYVEDIPNGCWWIVYRFPQGMANSEGAEENQSISSSTSPQPITLLALLKTQISSHRPALELRLRLASQLADTLSSMYNSGWMHKDIRSENILFPFTWTAADPGRLKLFHDISSPILAGFEYSGLHSEQQTIDKGQQKALAIYRHPQYQGNAASGYKMRYDMYSFGMVLLEIASWRPLTSFLDLNETQLERRNSGGENNQIKLSSKMKGFHTDEAEEFRNQLLALMEKELAFRVSTAYFRAVSWCLGGVDSKGTSMSSNDDDDKDDKDDRDDNDDKEVNDDKDDNDDKTKEEEEWRPALEFFNNVVEPLAKLAKNM